MFYHVIQAADGTLTLEAGEVQGITKGASFNVYDATNVKARLLCSVVADKVLTCSTLVHVNETGNAASSTVPMAGWALQTHTGEDANVCIAFPNRDAFPGISECVEKEMGHHGRPTIRFVEGGQTHELMVVAEGERAVFDITDETCCSNGLRRLPCSVPSNINSIYSILEHATHFFWHLRRSKEMSRIASSVTVEAKQLTNLDPGENAGISTLVPTGIDMNVNSVIRMTSAETGRLGFTIKSAYPFPLYVWLFSFNMSELSIGVSFTFNLAHTRGLNHFGQTTSINLLLPNTPNKLTRPSCEKGYFRSVMSRAAHNVARASPT